MPKGIYKRTQKYIKRAKKMGKAHKGKYKSKKHRKKLSLALKNKPISLFHKKNCQCPFCKAKRGETKGKKNIMFGKKHSVKTRLKMRINHANVSGQNCHFYIDGRTDLHILIRNLKEYDIWRNKVFKRDNFTCQSCDKNNCYLEPHHKKAFTLLLQNFLRKYNQFSPIEDKEILIKLAMKYKPFWNINNGKTLCEDCHKQTKNFRKKASVEILKGG